MRLWLISSAFVSAFSSCHCQPSVKFLLCGLSLRAKRGTLSPDVIIIIAPRLVTNRTVICSENKALDKSKKLYSLPIHQK